MTQTNAQVGFKTRYCIQVIDRVTGEPVSDQVQVDNLVLRSGMLALGDEIAYSRISLGISNIPASVDQPGLISSVSDLPLSAGTFEQSVFESPTSEDVISRISRLFIFKDFRFPSNARTLTLREIGITGVTRAVLPEPLEITPSHWVRVVAEIDYTYQSQVEQAIPLMINEESTSEVLRYNITPFVYNPHPQNTNGKGYGAANALLGYVWNGLTEGVSDRSYSATIGLSVTSHLNREECTTTFHVTGSFIADTEVPGFIIRDTLNGGAFKITFPERLVVQEDDSLDLVFTYSWRQNPPVYL